MDKLSRNITTVRSEICNLALIVFAIFAVPSLGASLYRTTSIGWQPVMTAHIFLAIVLWSVTLFRHRVPYNLRGGYLVAMMIVVAVGGVWQFGLVAGGAPWLIAAPVLATILFGIRLGVAIGIFCFLSFAAIGLHTVLENRLPPFDLAVYATHPQAWVNNFFGFAMIAGILAAATEMTNRYLIIGLEEKIRLLLESTSDGIYAVDTKGKINIVNQAAVKMLGFGLKDLIGNNYHDIFHQTRSDGTPYPPKQCPIYTSLNAGESHRVDGEVFGRKDDSSFPVEYTSTPIKEKSMVVGAVVVFRDITERKKAEEALRESEERFRLLSEASFEGIAITDKGIILDANVQFAKMFGHDHNEVIGMEVQRLVAPESRDLVAQKIKAGFQELYDHLALKKDGSIIHVEVHGKPIPYEGRNVRVTAIRDITERKKAEEELEKSYNIINRSPAVALLWKNETGWPVEFVSDNVQEVFGYSVEEFKSGKVAYAEIVHPDDLERVSGEVATFSEEKDRIEFTHIPYRIVTKDGQEKWLDDRTYMHRDEKGMVTRYQGIVLDITERRSLEAHLQQAQQLESIGILAGGIAHDFNNLLSVIMGYIELAKDEIKSEVGIYEFIAGAEKASLQAQELTKQLITFSKGGAPVKKIGSIGELVKETTNFSVLDTNTKCEFSIPHDLWLAEFDEGQMKHAINNIVGNAVEFMAEGGIIDLKAENFIVTAEQGLPITAGKYVKISIRDQGVGIPEEHLSKVFDPYFSTKEMGTQKGMGLGLATTYSIVNRHDGHIAIESEKGVGTTFALYLPVYEKDIRELKPVEMLKPQKPAIRTGRILVMDDEEMIRNLANMILNRFGYDVGLAIDGVEAIELYQKALDSGKPFEVVILDLTVKGGMGGRDAVKKILEISPQAKAIVSSGYSKDPVMTRFKDYGFIGALPKPYKLKDLKDVLNKVTKK